MSAPEAAMPARHCESVAWTGGNDAAVRSFGLRHRDEFWWGHAALDDGRLDRTVLEVWPHSADPWVPTLAYPGDTVCADGRVIRGGAL
ncbi:MAG TPA: hypothetical protein VG411_20405 [Actinomycetota bacterium]|nr:hypothetical protein [Actinomycetota bacterium]